MIADFSDVFNRFSTVSTATLLFYFLLHFYFTINTIINKLLKEVKNTDVFEFYLKCRHSPEYMNLYTILFNYAVVQIELGNIEEVKSTAEQLLKYHELNYISMDDVDIIDVL